MARAIISIAKNFGHRSESWLYRQITGIKRYPIHVVSYRYYNPEEHPHRPLTVISTPGRISSRVVTRPLFFLKNREALFELKQRRIIRRIARREDSFLIQAHYGWTGSMFLKIVQPLGLPYLVWFYGSDVFRKSDDNLAGTAELIASPAVFCCTSHAIRRQVQELGCRPERISVFHPGLEIAPSPPPRDYPDKGPFRIVSAGRLVDFKEPTGIVRIARILRDLNLDFMWEHLGDGPLRAETEEEIKRLGLENRFRLTGEVPNQAVLEALLGSDLMIHNAVVAPDGGRESFGVILVEAAAMGLPVVSARVGGIPEIVQDGVTGFLVDEGDLEGMAEKAQALLKGGEQRARFGKAAHAHALEHFDSIKQARKLEDYYARFLPGD